MKVTVTRETLKQKVLQGLGENHCMIAANGVEGKRASLNEIFEPLAKYLERKGIEVK